MKNNRQDTSWARRGMTKADAVREFVRQFPGQWSSYEISRTLGISSAYVSSFLNKEWKAGRVKRTDGLGPNGGYVWG